MTRRWSNLVRVCSSRSFGFVLQVVCANHNIKPWFKKCEAHPRDLRYVLFGNLLVSFVLGSSTLLTVHDPQNYVTFVPITDILRARCCATQRKSGKGGRPLVPAPIYTTAQRDLDHSTDHVSIGSLSNFVCIWHFKQFSSLKRVCSYQGDYQFQLRSCHWDAVQVACYCRFCLVLG
jgi:hypothetical protein